MKSSRERLHVEPPTDADELAALARKWRSEAYATLVYHEARSSRAHFWQPRGVPGPLQTPEYATTLMTRAGLPAEKIAAEIAITRGRLEALRADPMRRCIFYIGAAILHLPSEQTASPLPANTLRAQLEFLLALRTTHTPIYWPAATIALVTPETGKRFEQDTTLLSVHDVGTTLAYYNSDSQEKASDAFPDLLTARATMVALAGSIPEKESLRLLQVAVDSLVVAPEFPVPQHPE
jgi:Domain of unknown function (DUF5753)